MATSSSDAIHPVSASDPDAAAVPSASPPREPSALDGAAGEADPLVESESGEVDLNSGSGSSTFALPPGLIVPDPILRVLSESPAREVNRVEPDPAPGPAEPPRESDVVSSSTGSLDPIGALGISDQPAASRARPARGKAAGSEDDVEIEYVNGPNWPMVLLASYASAVTLALIWWVVLPRLRGKGEGDTFSTPTPAAVGTRRADRSRKVEPAAPIPADRMTTLGRPLRIGSLEITPMEVARTDVKLRRSALSGKEERKDGGAGAMALRLRLRNTSGDVVFTPLREESVRDGDNDLSESFVELDSGERIYLYPLPVDSEWSIVGQSFPELKPGEAKEARVVTEADFPSTASGMTWRLQLRTGLKETATIGVRMPDEEEGGG